MKLNKYAKLAWAALLFTLVVIVWGAYVRASGSGAGCGKNWPLCKGGVWSVETLIELTHRATSGLALILTVAMLVFAFRKYPRGHLVRRGATLSMIFMITEALVGAGLVKFELVAHNASVARALFMSVHLVNTFILLGVMTLTAWWASGGPPLRLRRQGALLWLFLASILGTLILGVSGAIAALGDTLFPAGSFAEGISQDFSPTAHLLLRLRVLHPTLALTVGLVLIIAGLAARQARPQVATVRFATALQALIFIQIVAGLVNVLLLTPIWLQLVHLVLADLTWIALVLTAGSALSSAQETSGLEVSMSHSARPADA